MSDTEYDDMLRQVKAKAGDLELLVEIANGDDDERTAADLASLEDLGASGLTFEPDDEDDPESTGTIDGAADAARELLDEYGLSFTITGERSPGSDWEATGWVYVLGTGGPHTELRDDGYVHGWGWSGANQVRAAVSSDVVDYFESWAEAL